MRFPNLQRVLIDLVIATAPAAALSGCFLTDDDCTDLVQREYRVAEPPPAALVTIVRACESDASRCIELCNALLDQEFGGDNEFSPNASACDVEHDATGHDVTLAYEVPTGNTGCPVPGRRPPGLARAGRPRGGVVGTHLARSAWFEAASVHAFVGLARELGRHRAPARLRQAACRAAVDEVVHARLMGRLARARGVTPPPVAVAAPRRRSIESLAIENVSEGVVGETWAALIATWQARHAADPAERAIYAAIASDEIRHAELAREVDAWSATRLRPAARRRVEAARRRAVAKLARGVRAATPRALVRDVGMPDSAAMQRLFAGARDQLWNG